MTSSGGKLGHTAQSPGLQASHRPGEIPRPVKVRGLDKKGKNGRVSPPLAPYLAPSILGVGGSYDPGATLRDSETFRARQKIARREAEDVGISLANHMHALTKAADGKIEIRFWPHSTP